MLCKSNVDVLEKKRKEKNLLANADSLLWYRDGLFDADWLID